jgi:ribosomal protein L13E
MHQAYVVHRDTKKKARGFSCAEIEEAGMTCKDFDALKLPWDSMRKSKYAENVSYLKKLEKPAAKAKTPKAAKK